MIKLKNILLEGNLDSPWHEPIGFLKKLQTVTVLNARGNEKPIIKDVKVRWNNITRNATLVGKYFDSIGLDNISFFKDNKMLINIQLFELKLTYSRGYTLDDEKENKLGEIYINTALNQGFRNLGKFAKSSVVFANVDNESITKGNNKLIQIVFISVLDKKDKNWKLPNRETEKSTNGYNMINQDRKMFWWSRVPSFIKQFKDKVASDKERENRPPVIEVPSVDDKIVFGYNGSEPSTNIKIRNIKAILKLPHSSNDPMHFDNELKGYLQQYQSENGLVVNGEWNLETVQFIAANPEIFIISTTKGDQRRVALDADEDSEEAVTSSDNWTLLPKINFDWPNITPPKSFEEGVSVTMTKEKWVELGIEAGQISNAGLWTSFVNDVISWVDQVVSFKKDE